MARVSVILAISYTDLVTNVMMLFQYQEQGAINALVASACFIGIGWLAHMYYAFHRCHGAGRATVAWEMLIAATFMAPAVATYRFVVGVEEHEHEHGADAIRLS